MLPSNPICAVCDYGTSATYRDLPSDEQLRNGVVPLDSLPAAWWNCMWNMTNHSINQARSAVGVLIDEINTVLTQAGVCACDICVDQLYRAIDNISQTIGNAVRAGAVKSSSCCGQVSIDDNGIMTANGLGNAACLTTTAQTAIGAINELKSTYDSCWSANATALNGKAPTSHASSADTYGVGSAANYGHLKISDTYTSVLAACSGVAASQMALACVYAVAAAAAAGNVSLGNTAGCALGTAAAGTATTAARSDHVHPKPSRTDLGFGTAVNCDASAFLGASGCAVDSAKLTGKAPSALCVACAGQAYCVMDYYSNATPLYIGYACTGLTCAQITHLAAFSTNYTSGKTVIKDVCKGNVQSWLGLGTAACCAATAFRASTWTPSCVACAGANGSGTAFGDAATRGVFTRTTVGDIGWETAANRTKVVDVGAMAYWNGAYQGTSSNLRYFCGGTFGSAATCAASCFLGATAKACCSATADRATILSKTTSNVTCAINISSADASIVRLSAVCGNNTRNLTVNCADCANIAVNAACAGTIVRCSDAICIRCVKVSTYVCVYCICNRTTFPILFAPSITSFTECERACVCPYIGWVIPASAEYSLGPYNSCIGQWSTCYLGIRVS